MTGEWAHGARERPGKESPAMRAASRDADLYSAPTTLPRGAIGLGHDTAEPPSCLRGPLYEHRAVSNGSTPFTERRW